MGQEGQAAWFIDVNSKRITKMNNRYILYDLDKITPRIVFEGSIEQLFGEFELKGYQRVTL